MFSNLLSKAEERPPEVGGHLVEGLERPLVLLGSKVENRTLASGVVGHGLDGERRPDFELPSVVSLLLTGLALKWVPPKEIKLLTNAPVFVKVLTTDTKYDCLLLITG